MSDKLPVAIVGMGELGAALSQVLKRTGRVKVDGWDKDEAKNTSGRMMGEVVRDKEAVLLCVPSDAMRKAAEAIGEHISKSAVVLSLAKGLELPEGKTMDQVLEEVLPGRLTVLVGGPMLAEELATGLPGSAVMAGKEGAEVKVQALFDGSGMRLTYSSDQRGVAWAGLMKNVYAIGLGMIDEFGFGSNARGWYFQQALDEMAGIIEGQGGERMSAYSLAGLGDLVATGMSHYSSNFEAGKSLARGEAAKGGAEGLKSLPAVWKRVQSQRGGSFEILTAINEIVQGGVKPLQRWEDLFRGRGV